jgi:hypothetical protein
MPYIEGTYIGKLKILLKKEKLSINSLQEEMARQCSILGIKPITTQELSKIGFGDRPDRLVSTYLKVLNALNSLRRNGHPQYKLEDLIDYDEILKPKK